MDLYNFLLQILYFDLIYVLLNKYLTYSSTPPPYCPAPPPPPSLPAMVVRWYFEQREDWVRRRRGEFMFGDEWGKSSNKKGFAWIVWGSPVSSSDQNTEQKPCFTLGCVCMYVYIFMLEYSCLPEFWNM